MLFFHSPFAIHSHALSHTRCTPSLHHCYSHPLTTPSPHHSCIHTSLQLCQYSNPCSCSIYVRPVTFCVYCALRLFLLLTSYWSSLSERKVHWRLLWRVGNWCGCRQLVWRVGNWCGVQATGVGCRQLVWGAGNWCGVQATGMECKQLLWCTGNFCGVRATGVGYRQLVWGTGNCYGVLATIL